MNLIEGVKFVGLQKGFVIHLSKDLPPAWHILPLSQNWCFPW